MRTAVKLKDTRRRYAEEFRNEAVQMLLDGHSAPSVMERLGLPNVNMLYRWKKERIASSGVVAGSLEARVRELENELRRVKRERDILKSVGHFRPQRIADVYQVVDLIIQAGIGSVVEACQILDVNRTAFYPSCRCQSQQNLQVPQFECLRHRFGHKL